MGLQDNSIHRWRHRGNLSHNMVVRPRPITFLADTTFRSHQPPPLSHQSRCLRQGLPETGRSVSFRKRVFVADVCLLGYKDRENGAD